MKNFVGLNGKIYADEDGVTLIRESKIDGVFHELGTVRIPISEIAKVIYSEGGLTNGYIAFLRKGDRRPLSVFSALKNDNTVIFRFTKNESAQQMAEYVKSLI